jgi:hypothetical protein
MCRFGISLITSLLGVTCLSAGQFDQIDQLMLQSAIEKGQAKEIKDLTGAVLAEKSGALSDTPAASLLVVLSNDRRLCKLLVQPARQRIGMDLQVPTLLIDKFITFREGTDRALRASGSSLNIYPSMRFMADLGQVVPEKLGGDLLVEELASDPFGFIIKPLKEAKMYVIEKSILPVTPKKEAKKNFGDPFESHYFTGTYKLQDDGRRSGTLTLGVSETGEVSGSFYSDRDGQKYDVKGKIGTPRHSINFRIKFPATEQEFTGMMFTGNGKLIAGTSKLAERESAFVAERTE